MGCAGNYLDYGPSNPSVQVNAVTSALPGGELRLIYPAVRPEIVGWRPLPPRGFAPTGIGWDATRNRSLNEHQYRARRQEKSAPSVGA